MTIPSKFHIDLADRLGRLLVEGAPVVRTVEDSEGWFAEFAYSADTYAGRVHWDLQALAEVAGWKVSSSWMPYCRDPEVIKVCLRFSPPAPVAHAPKPVKPRK